MCVRCFLQPPLSPPGTTGQCKCGSKDAKSLEDIRTAISRDLIDYKVKIRDIAYKPIVFVQSLHELTTRLTELENARFIFFTDEFMPGADLNSSLFTIEKYLTEYLRDFAPTLKYLYDTVIDRDNSCSFDPERLRAAQIRIKIIASRLTPFETGVNEACKILFDDLKKYTHLLQKYQTMYQWLETHVKNWKNFLETDEKILFLTHNVKTTGTLHSLLQSLLVTTKYVVLLKRMKFSWNRKYSISIKIDKKDIKYTKIRERKRFKQPVLLVQDENILHKFYSKESTLKTINKTLVQMNRSYLALPVSQWKIWNILWSTEEFRLTVYNLLNSDITAETTGQGQGQGSSPGPGLRPDQSSAETNHPRQTDSVRAKKVLQDEELERKKIKNYFLAQLQKIHEQILTSKSFLEDLVNRRSELELSEYYQKYESFSLKLAALEEERDKLISQYHDLTNV